MQKEIKQSQFLISYCGIHLLLQEHSSSLVHKTSSETFSPWCIFHGGSMGRVFSARILSTKSAQKDFKNHKILVWTLNQVLWFSLRDIGENSLYHYISVLSIELIIYIHYIKGDMEHVCSTGFCNKEEGTLRWNLLSYYQFWGYSRDNGSPSCLWFAPGYIFIYINTLEALWMSQEVELSTGIKLLANFLPPTFIFRFIRYGIYFCHCPAVDKKQEKKKPFPLITEAKWEYLNRRRLGTSTVLFFQLQTQLKPVCSAFVLHWKGKLISRILL